jgi:hypothetical protein
MGCWSQGWIQRLLLLPQQLQQQRQLLPVAVMARECQCRRYRLGCEWGRLRQQQRRRRPLQQLQRQVAKAAQQQRTQQLLQQQQQRRWQQ